MTTLGLLLATMLAAQVPETWTLNADTPWVVAADEPEPMRRCLEDVATDWYKVLGHPPIILAEPPEGWQGPLVYLGSRGPWLKALAGELPAAAECFVLRETRDAAGRPCLVAHGSDLRGSIFAAYTLSENLLGVDPWYFWTDMEPAFRGALQVAPGYHESFGPPTFKYRGWFVNDEDLLNVFAQDPMKENVIGMETFDRIYETVLRLRGNMMVPATFAFPDEQSQILAARRGLALNHHHIQVVGLNTYRWPSRLPYSYQTDAEILERQWQACVDFLAPFEVVWTVGYRGKHDRPFWSDDPTLDTPEKRGAQISRAIARQVEMIRRHQPDAMIISNLWMEGANLYHDGHITLPPDVTLVWADDGAGIPRDAGRVQAGQGVYYHTAMLSGWHNQLSEMIPPGRIYAELGRYARAGATEFFLVNVSDVRPVPLSTDCAMKFVWDASAYLDKSDRENMDAFIEQWCERYLGPGPHVKEAAALYNEYFDLPYHRRPTRQGDNRFHRMLRQLGQEAGAAIAESSPLSEAVLKRAAEYLEGAEAALELLQPLSQRVDALEARIPADRRDFFHGHLTTQTAVHLHCNAMLAEYCRGLAAYAEGGKAAAVGPMTKALAACERFFAALRSAEYGRWRGFYEGETMMAVQATRNLLLTHLAHLSGQPVPPLRRNRGYPGLYEYQLGREAHFPFFYPQGGGEAGPR